MAGENLSPNMSLPVPGVGVTSGPQYATDVNNCMAIIDAHTHASGSGVPITPSAININANLTMNNFSLTSIAALTLSTQTITPSNQSVYVSGVDLYYVDGSGNNIRITQSGSVSGSAGTITGLPSGTASASFGASTFVFQSATNTAANIDGASFIFRNNTASSFGLTLAPPNAMGANYSLTLPSIPGSTSFMTIDTSGNMSGSISTTAGITKPMLAALGQQATASSGSFVWTGSGLSGNVVSLSITTTGRPVFILLQSAATDGSFISTSEAAQATSTSTFYIYRDGVALKAFTLEMNAAGSSTCSIEVPPSSIMAIDTSATAGTHTYALKISGATGSTSTSVTNASLIAYEL